MTDVFFTLTGIRSRDGVQNIRLNEVIPSNLWESSSPLGGTVIIIDLLYFHGRREALRVAKEASVEQARRIQKEASSKPSWSPLRPLPPTSDAKPTPSPRQHHIFRTKPPTPTHAPALSEKVGGSGRSVTEWVKVVHPPSPSHGGGGNDDVVIVSATEAAGAGGGKKSIPTSGDGGEGGRDGMPESALKPTDSGQKEKTEGSDLAESDKGGKTEEVGKAETCTSLPLRYSCEGAYDRCVPARYSRMYSFAGSGTRSVSFALSNRICPHQCCRRIF